MKHMYLLGDSIIDNKVYVGPGEFSVLEHLESLSDLDFSQLAVDGDTTVDVLNNQLESLDKTSDFTVLSIGGNDLLEHLPLLVDSINKKTFSRNLEIMNEFIDPIKDRYEKIVEHLSKKEGKLLLCTVYNGDFERDDGHEDFMFGFGDLLKGKQIGDKIKDLEKKKFLGEAKRVPRKKGQHRGSKSHSDLYTDENPKGTIHGLKFATVKDAKASVSKIRGSGKTHAHKIQAAVAMEQRAREMGKTSEAAVYRKFINTMKKKTKQMNESVQNNKVDLVLKTDVNNVLKQDNKDYDRGLLAKVNKDGSYDVAYWYDKYKAYPVEVEIDGKSVKKDAKNIHIKFHPELKKKNKEEAKKAMNEGSLHKWFKGSKSKDGKGGWVNVVTGGTCASDEPGEGTPKCVSSAKRASMTKAERLSAARRKKKADPGQQSKSGAAKPTYVSTDSPRKKKMKEETSVDEVIKLIEKKIKIFKNN